MLNADMRTASSPSPLPTMQGKGLGGQLMRSLIEVAQSRQLSA
jgi:predicted N-acetyltransferase YhbS